MKIRNGFVSNSSTSSFFLAIKKGRTLDVLETLNDGHGPFFDILYDIIDTIKHNAKELNDHMAHENGYITGEEYLADCYPSEWKVVKSLMRNGYTIYVGSFSSEGDDPIEIMLCDANLNYNSDDLVIIHDGGY